ncbi:hypothetical protein M426DRAFT_170078 [Hypoxylon sp. CI-4A]|nr:hypothetical protein M426DRAFT_170078 [Hypoxylon sp. CI-4A]
MLRFRSVLSFYMLWTILAVSKCRSGCTSNSRRKLYQPKQLVGSGSQLCCSLLKVPCHGKNNNNCDTTQCRGTYARRACYRIQQSH